MSFAARMVARVNEHRLSLISAGVAFYAILALFPAITAVLAIGGLILDPETIVTQITDFEGVVPDDVLSIVGKQAMSVTAIEGLELTVVVGLLIAIFSASRGMANIIVGLNAVFDRTETRGFILLNLQIFFLTILLIFGVIAGMVVLVLLPVLMSFLDLNVTTGWLSAIGRWAVLCALTILGLSVVYRYGPSRPGPRWRWISPGSVVACALWVIGSYAFTVYASSFAHYNESFGALAGVIVLLLWLWLSAFAMLMGAEINAELADRARAQEEAASKA